MTWEVHFDEDFAGWYERQEAGLRIEIVSVSGLLKQFGPHLGRPQVETIEESSYSNMKELRVQYKGDPWRILFAFDPQRAAILLVGGCKAGDKRWYKKNVPIADERFRRHLENLKP